jgi:hypothetical protein
MAALIVFPLGQSNRFARRKRTKYAAANGNYYTLKWLAQFENDNIILAQTVTKSIRFWLDNCARKIACFGLSAEVDLTALSQVQTRRVGQFFPR